MDIIAAIDHATGCHHCGSDLQHSVSDLFCSPDCQTAWHTGRTVPLADYTEPTDLPQYVGNLVELYSPDTTPGFTPALFPADAVAAWADMAAAAMRSWARVLEHITDVFDTVIWHGINPPTPPADDEHRLDTTRFAPATFDLATPDKPTLHGAGRVPHSVLAEVRQATFGEPPTVPTATRSRALTRFRDRTTGPAHRQRPPRAITARRSR